MELDPVFLSRVQFGFLVSFHIIFPAFTIGLAAWLATIEGARLVTGNPVYRRVFDFWLKVFAVSFGMGVVTCIVMAFQFCTNWVAHTKVAFMFDEEKRREPGKDTLTTYHGLLGSYPNFLFNVSLDEIDAFAGALHAARTREQFLAVVKAYGLSRTHPQIWENFHWFVDYLRRHHPIQAGVYDLNRYKKVSDLLSDENG